VRDEKVDGDEDDRAVDYSRCVITLYKYKYGSAIIFLNVTSRASGGFRAVSIRLERKRRSGDDDVVERVSRFFSKRARYGSLTFVVARDAAVHGQ